MPTTPRLRIFTRRAGALGAALLAVVAHAQQLADNEYLPPVARPMYTLGEGPRVCVDEAHFNFHTLGGRFHAFAALLRRDGYRPVASTRKFDGRSLAHCDVLVVSNAQPSDAEWDVYPYPTPSAFGAAEIRAVRTWVEDGGALLLIADHMPLAGAAAKLAAAFDVEFTDVFVNREPRTDAPDLFTIADGTLKSHAITSGRDAREAVTGVRTFTGQAFRAPKAAPLLVFPEGFTILKPIKAWEFTDQTPRLPAAGWLQGAAQKVGKGRAVFFGEAAMFTAQLSGPDRRPMGMNAPGAEANFQLVLNVLHWLTGTL